MTLARYAAVDSAGNVQSLVMWDGVSDYAHGDGLSLAVIQDGWDVVDGKLAQLPATDTPPTSLTPNLPDRLAALAAERYAQQSGGVMFQAASASSPSRVASDPLSTGMLTASYLAARDSHWTDGTPWKMADGSFVALTAADMQAMALKVLGFISACFAHESALATALASDLTTDITVGWPANT